MWDGASGTGEMAVGMTPKLRLEMLHIYGTAPEWCRQRAGRGQGHGLAGVSGPLTEV